MTCWWALQQPAGHRLNGESCTDVERDRVGQRHQDIGGGHSPFGISTAFFDESGNAVAYFDTANAWAKLWFRKNPGHVRDTDRGG